MKKRTLLTLAASTMLLASCGGGDKPETPKTSDQTPTTSETRTSETVTSEVVVTSEQPVVTSSSEDTSALLASYKKAALDKLDEIVYPNIAKIPHDELKAETQKYYDTEKTYVNEITNLETAKNAVNKVIEDTKNFAINVLKPLAIEKVNSIINPLIEKIPYAPLETSVKNFYDKEMAKIAAITTLDDLVTVYQEAIEDTKSFIEEETKKAIATLRDAALAKLDELVYPYIAKIPHENLKKDTQDFYDREKKYITEIDSIDTAKDVVDKVVNDSKDFAINSLKPVAVELVNNTINPLIQEIPYEPLKTSVQSFYDTEMGKIATIGSVGEVVTIYQEIIEDTKTFIKDETKKAINTLKQAAFDKLDELINPVIDKIPNDTLKAEVQGYYNDEKAVIIAIEDIDTAKDAVQKVIDDTKYFVFNRLKAIALSELNAQINPLISQISDPDLRQSVQSYYNTQIRTLEGIESVDGIVEAYNAIVSDTKEFIKQQLEALIIEAKNKALEELDPYVNELIDMIPYDAVKTDTRAFYNTEKAKLEAVDTVEGFAPCVTEIKKDLADFALAETKKIALAKLQEVIDAGLEKCPHQAAKDDLREFSKGEIAKINAVETISEVPIVLETVLKETAEHIARLAAALVKDYVNELFEIENTTAYNYLPEAMNPTYAANTVSAADIAYDFTTDTSVGAIKQAGYGEQWQMVVENINQSIAVAKVLNIANVALKAAGDIITTYLDAVSEEELEAGLSYNVNSTENQISGKFKHKDQLLQIALKMSKDIEIPAIGTFKPDIYMGYDISTNTKTMYINLGDAYKVKYVITDTTYILSSTYGVTVAGKEGSRSAYLSVNKNDNGKTTGHIYEYTTYEGSDMISACADFYVENGYVSVVGNKASGMVGFDGYVSELYSATEGRLLGYEVREEVLGVGYDTLWFNLWDIGGINSVKVTDKTDANKSGKSTVDVYLNGSTALLSPTYNTKVGIKTSRKYDVEYRNRYYYTYDAENEKYVCNEVQVPMFFVQEGDNYNSLASDMLKDNKITVSVSLSSVKLNKILSDYDTYIPVFIENKDSMSSEAIIAYLSTGVSIEEETDE